MGKRKGEARCTSYCGKIANLSVYYKDISMLLKSRGTTAHTALIRTKKPHDGSVGGGGGTPSKGTSRWDTYRQRQYVRMSPPTAFLRLLLSNQLRVSPGPEPEHIQAAPCNSPFTGVARCRARSCRDEIIRTLMVSISDLSAERAVTGRPSMSCFHMMFSEQVDSPG